MILTARSGGARGRDTSSSRIARLTPRCSVLGSGGAAGWVGCAAGVAVAGGCGDVHFVRSGAAFHGGGGPVGGLLGVVAGLAVALPVVDAGRPAVFGGQDVIGVADRGVAPGGAAGLVVTKRSRSARRISSRGPSSTRTRRTAGIGTPHAGPRAIGAGQVFNAVGRRRATDVRFGTFPGSA
jgi:hypothetical protein